LLRESFAGATGCFLQMAMRKLLPATAFRHRRRGAPHSQKHFVRNLRRHDLFTDANERHRNGTRARGS
jgi:hypothetical protein